MCKKNQGANNLLNENSNALKFVNEKSRIKFYLYSFTLIMFQQETLNAGKQFHRNYSAFCSRSSAATILVSICQSSDCTIDRKEIQCEEKRMNPSVTL